MNAYRLVLVGMWLTLVAFSSASAQTCPIYTYEDVFVDENGAITAINYTEPDPACGPATAFASVNLRLPGGFSGYDSASGSIGAEAVVSGPADPGDGFLARDNEVDYSCLSTFVPWWEFPISIGFAFTKHNWNGGRLLNVCSVEVSCINVPLCRLGGIRMAPEDPLQGRMVQRILNG